MKTHKQTGFTLTRKPFESAFTLIELLIVIAIISLLAAISIFALSGARKTGRDAARKADLETIRSALEFYRADCGDYPLTAAFPTGGVFKGPDTCGANIYITEIPQDTAADRKYSYSSSDGIRYILCAALEGDTTKEDTCASCIDNGSSVDCSYKTTNP